MTRLLALVAAIAACLLLPASALADPLDARTAFWRLNDPSASGQAADSVDSHPGTYHLSNTAPVGGATRDSDTAIDLDGVDDYVSTTYNPFVNGTARSFEGWAKRDTTTTHDMVFSGAGLRAPTFYLPQGTTNAKFWPDAGVGSSVTWTGIPTGEWFHWVVVFDEPNNTVELYINGVSKGSQTMTTPYSSSTGNFAIGYNTVDNPFDGSLDDVAVYNRALTSTEVGQLYNSISQLNDARIAFWRLSELTGTNADDPVGGHDGTYSPTPTLGAAGATTDGSEKAVHLDGVDDRVTTLWNPFTNGGAQSFEGWAKRDSTTTADMIFSGNGSRNPAFYLQANSTNARFWPDAGVGSSTSWPNMPTGQWFHWVLVFDERNNKAELFVDGESQGVQAMSTPYNASSGNFTLGYQGSTNAFGGSLDDVAVYNRALSPTEAADLAAPISFKDSFEAGTFPFQFAGAAWEQKYFGGTGGYIDQVTPPTGVSATDGTHVVNAGLTPSSTRAEIQCHRSSEVWGSDNNCAGAEGSEFIYEFDVRIPSGTTIPSQRPQIVMQTKPSDIDTSVTGYAHSGCYGGGLQVGNVADSSKVEFVFATASGPIGDNGGFCTTPESLDPDSLGTFSKDSWHHFKLHARWSVDENVGFVQAWVDGREALARRSQATLIGGTGRLQMFRLGVYESNNAQYYGGEYNVLYDNLVIREL
jgi:hypothetical protein